MAKYRENSQDTWKTLKIKALDSMPVGTIMQYAGETIPNGWLLCNGDAVASTEYPELYEAIGTTYGGTSDNFRLPDFRGRVAVGLEPNDQLEDFDTLGKTGGSKYLQAHTHNLKYSDGGAVGRGGYTTTSSSYAYDTSAGSIESAGTGDSGNLQPYLVVNYIIKAFSVVPTMRGITNNYSTSTQDGYSCNYINNLQPTTIWESSASTMSGTTLSLDLTPYKYIEVIFYTETATPNWMYLKSTGKLKVLASTTFTLGDFIAPNDSSQAPQFFGRNMTINNTKTSITIGSGFNVSGSTYTTHNSSGVPIEIIGYK